MVREKMGYFGLFTLLFLLLSGSTGEDATENSLASLDFFLRLLWTDIHAALQYLLDQSLTATNVTMTSTSPRTQSTASTTSTKATTRTLPAITQSTASTSSTKATTRTLRAITTQRPDRILPLQGNSTCRFYDLDGNCCDGAASCQTNTTTLCDNQQEMAFDIESDTCLHLTSLSYCYWLIESVVYADCNPWTSMDLTTFKCVNSYNYDEINDQYKNMETCEAFQTWLMDKEECLIEPPKLFVDTQKCDNGYPFLLLQESHCTSCEGTTSTGGFSCKDGESFDLQCLHCVRNPPPVFNMSEWYYEETFVQCPTLLDASVFHLGRESCTWGCVKSVESTMCTTPFVWDAKNGICTSCLQIPAESGLDQCSVPGLVYNLKAGCFSNAFDSNECSYSCVACSLNEVQNTICPADQVYCVSCGSCVPKPNIATGSFTCKEGYTYCISSGLCRSQPLWSSSVEDDEVNKKLVPDFNRTECSLPRNLTLVFKRTTCSNDSDCAWDYQCCTDPGSRNRQCVRFDGSVSSESIITVTTSKPVSPVTLKTTIGFFSKSMKLRINEDYNKTVGSRKLQFLNSTRYQFAAAVRIPPVCFLRMDAKPGSVILNFDMSNEPSPSTDVAKAYEQLAALMSNGQLQIFGLNGSQLNVPPQSTDGSLITQQNDNSQVIIIGAVVGCICALILIIAVGCIIWKNKKQTVVRSIKPMSQGALQPVYRSFPYEGSLEGSDLNVARLRSHLPTNRPPRSLDDLHSDDPAYLGKLAQSYDIPTKLSDYELKRSWQELVTPPVAPRVFTTSGRHDSTSSGFTAGFSSAELLRNWSPDTTPDAAKYRTPSRGLAMDLINSLTPRTGNRRGFVSSD